MNREREEKLVAFAVQPDGMFAQKANGPWCSYRVAKRIIDAQAARIAELERLHEKALNERDAAHDQIETLSEELLNRAEAAEAENKRLTEALAAAEAECVALNAAGQRMGEWLQQDKTELAQLRERCKELEAQLAQAQSRHPAAGGAAKPAS